MTIPNTFLDTSVSPSSLDIKDVNTILDIKAFDRDKKIDSSKTALLPKSNTIHADPDRIVYFTISDELMEEGFKEAERLVIKNGTINKNVFWKKMTSDAQFKSVIINKLKDKLNEECIKQKIINSEYRIP